MEAQVPDKWLWKGRHLKIVDGSNITVADTKENRTEFGSPFSNGKMARCPITRLVVIFSLATGCVLDVANGPYRGKFSGETNLFLKLIHNIKPKDIVIGDAYYNCFHILAMLLAQGADAIFRENAARPIKGVRLTRISKHESIIKIRKTGRSEGISKEQYEKLPEEICLRLCKIKVVKKGFRTKDVTILTTLTDPNQASLEEIAEIYRKRWHAELNLRSIKTVLNIHFLPSKTPEMVKKEILITMLAYNLIRRVMGEVACKFELIPLEISFSSAVQQVRAHSQLWKFSHIDRNNVWQLLLKSIARHKVGNRPDRVEPRAIKYWISNKYPNLNQPRDHMRIHLPKRHIA